jgi:DNA replication protein DnaC
MDKELEAILKYLRLGGLLARWDEYLAQARRGRFSHERLLKHVLKAEYDRKQEQARWLRRRRAHIPEILEIETFPFTRQPKLDRKRVMSLYDSFDYMTKQQNIAWLGPTGCGKTGLATGFLLQALDRGYRGYFITNISNLVMGEQGLIVPGGRYSVFY